MSSLKDGRCRISRWHFLFICLTISALTLVSVSDETLKYAELSFFPKSLFEKSPQYKTDTKFFNKDKTNSKGSIVFFAGLPFSNQIIYQKVLEEMCNKNCLSLLDLNALDYQLFFPRLMKNWTEATAAAKQNLNTLSEKYGEDKIFFVNIYSKNDVQDEITLTYPDLRGNQTVGRSIVHPNMLFLEELFISEGFEPYFILLMDDIEAISAHFIDYLARQVSLYSPSKSIALLKMLDMNLRNMLAQFSLLQSNKYVIPHDKASVRVPKIFTHLGLDANKNKMEEIFNTEVKNISFQLLPGEHAYVEKMKYIQNFYENKFSGKATAKIDLTEEDMKTKLVFFAGLEGTGHHLWRTITGEIKVDSSIGHHLTSTCSVTRLFYDQKLSCFQTFVDHKGFFCSAKSRSFKSARDNAVKSLKEHSNEFSNEEVILLNLAHFNFFSKKDKGECTVIASYPAYSGKDKTLNKPDLIDLAMITKEAEEYEFSPIVLLRRTADLVYSDIWHRNFNKQKPLVYEEKVLENNAASLLIELEVLNLKQLACVEFNRLVSDQQEIDLVADTLRMKHSDLRRVITRVFTKNSTEPEKILPGKHNLFISTLRKYNNKIYQLCNKDLD